MVDIQNLPVVMTGIGLIVAIMYYTLTLRNATKTRQAQLYMQIYDKWSSPEFNQQWGEIINNWEWEDFDDFNEKYGSENNSLGLSKWFSTAAYFEGIGVLVKRKLIDVSLVDDLMSGYIIRFWLKFSPIIVEWRERYDWPQALEWAEYLYNEISQIAEQQHPELKALS